MASLSWEKLVLLGLVVFVKEEGVVALDGILGGVWGRASGEVEWRCGGRSSNKKCPQTYRVKCVHVCVH